MVSRLIRYDCPHCQTNTLFSITSLVQAWNIPAGEGQIKSKRVIGTGDINRADTGTCCPECTESFVLILESPLRGVLEQFFSANSDEQADMLRDKIYPRHLVVRAGLPPLGHVPEQIRTPFSDALRDARQRRNAPGVMAVARGCLDVSLKELGQSAGGRKDRIRKLCDEGILTKDIGEWANRLWEEGNDAVHDLSATSDKATEHIDFLILFFEVAFGLPKRIAGAEAHASVPRE